MKILPNAEEIKSRGPLWILCAALIVLLTLISKSPETFFRKETEVRIVEIEKRVEVIKEVVKEKTVTVYKDRITTTIQPNGTKTVIEERSGTVVADVNKLVDRTVAQVSHKETTAKETAVAVVNSKPSYHLGAGLLVDLKGKITYSVEGGARLGGSPLFLTLILTTEPMVGVGVRLEF